MDHSGHVMSSGRRGASSLPPEIWRLVAKQILGHRVLRALIRVCRAFRDIFQPFLYAQFRFVLNERYPSALERSKLPEFLRYTKEFEVVVKRLEDVKGVDYFVELNEGYASFVSRALRAMPNLRSFRWFDGSMDMECDPSLILQNGELLATLESAPNLRELTLQYSALNTQGPDDLYKRTTQLQGFKNLTLLEIYGFFGAQSQLVEDIANVLKDCPRLTKLGLGMHYEVRGLPDSHEILVDNGQYRFLEELCLRYGTFSSPLTLETLRLGTGMFIIKSMSPDVGNYIEKLVNLQSVRNLHIYNGYIDPKFNWDEVVRSEVHWEFFAKCTSLHQLSVTTMDGDVRQWLNASGKSVQELIVTEHSSIFDQTLINYDFLNLPHLSMLFSREMAMESIVHDLYWDRMDEYGVESIHRLLHLSVLDRLHNHGANLTQLGICLDPKDQWERFIYHLGNMRYLTHLRMDKRRYQSGTYPPDSIFRYSTVTNPKDLAARYAKLMRSMCPTLQYIQIQSWSWQITAPLPGVSIPEEEHASQIELRELDWEERKGIELFAIGTSAQQSWLPAAEELCEEEWQEYGYLWTG